MAALELDVYEIFILTFSILCFFPFFFPFFLPFFLPFSTTFTFLCPAELLYAARCDLAWPGFFPGTLCFFADIFLVTLCFFATWCAWVVAALFFFFFFTIGLWGECFFAEKDVWVTPRSCATSSTTGS